MSGATQKSLPEMLAAHIELSIDEEGLGQFWPPKAAAFALRRAVALRLLMDEVAQHWTRTPRAERLLEAAHA